MAKIDSVFDFTDKGLVELKSWLEPWFLTRRGGGVAVEWEDVGVDCGGSSSGLAYGDYVTSFSTLIGYWRLGETGSPWVDTSGYTGGPRNMTLQTSGTPTALTAHVTGGLAAGQDDGAVQFNYDGHAANAGQSLSAGSGSLFNLANMAVACYAKIASSADSRSGAIVSNQDYVIASSAMNGWGLLVQYPSRKVRFSRGGNYPGGIYAESPGSLVANTWYHIAGTYDGANLKLYLNGTLVATTADASGAAAGVNGPVRIGFLLGNFDNLWLTGTVDEVAVWNAPLTAAEVAALYAAGL